MKYIGLISPYRGNGQDGEKEDNYLRARRWAQPFWEEGNMPVVPHTFFSRVLDDNIPKHREVGMACGRLLYTLCHEVHVEDWGKGISSGMQGDINFCRSKGVPLVWHCEEPKEGLNDRCKRT